MKGWDSKVGEDAVTECVFSNTFNAFVKTSRTSKRAIEGSIANPPERGGDDDLRESFGTHFHEVFTQLPPRSIYRLGKMLQTSAGIDMTEGLTQTRTTS
jgi:hypothetical protein